MLPIGVSHLIIQPIDLFVIDCLHTSHVPYCPESDVDEKFFVPHRSSSISTNKREVWLIHLWLIYPQSIWPIISIWLIHLAIDWFFWIQSMPLNPIDSSGSNLSDWFQLSMNSSIRSMSQSHRFHAINDSIQILVVTQCECYRWFNPKAMSNWCVEPILTLHLIQSVPSDNDSIRSIPSDDFIRRCVWLFAQFHCISPCSPSNLTTQCSFDPFEDLSYWF